MGEFKETLKKAMIDPNSLRRERIAVALERIADSLEKGVALKR